MASNSRTASYNVEEDRLLCHIYLDISQNPIIGIRQSKDQFWSRIKEGYNLNKPDKLQARNKRSLQCRMGNILHDISKLTGCVSQIEALRPSGASEEDIDSNLIMYGTSDSNPPPTQKTIHETNLDSSQSDMPTPNTPTSGSTGLPSFEINLSSDDTVGGTSSQRLLGVKKAKLKKKRDDNVSELISTMKEGHRDLLNVLQQGSTDLQQNYDIRMLGLQNEKKKLEIRQQKIALATLQEENKILYMDLNMISEPEVRDMVRKERAKILQNRNAARDQQEHETFGNYFGDLGGSGSNLGDY
ncbi:hypothetical protein F511_33468 [Dorcoceras hygrometricum]|uniref:No apical meristem-associated C-terminal domain-containing protein n=1 Tax=Dorcoceras hygrometricum TaxID=472368 RepID=A0A2Z7BFJ2_9LAMI|nr:hypothetical protein F511_33468 [Dorcoceras hygrometricum]